MTVEVTVRAEATRDISDTLLPAGKNFEELKQVSEMIEVCYEKREFPTSGGEAV
jgi:hypothetical protein